MAQPLRIPSDLKDQLAEHGIFPVDLIFYINSMCNLRCRHCYIGNDLLNAAVRYDAQSIENFSAQFAQLSRVTVLGGEPLLHPEINELMNGLSLQSIDELRVTTNLTHMKRFDYKRYSQKGVVFCVSIDGHSPEAHDYIRGVGAFVSTIENLKTMTESGCDVEVTHTVMDHNIDFFDEILDLCKSIGVKKLNLHRMSLHGNALENRHLCVSPTRWVNFCKKIEEKSQQLAHTQPVPANQLAISNLSQTGLTVRYPPLFVTKEKYQQLCLQGDYHSHVSNSFYGEQRGHRIVFFPDGKLYISSEAFGTESYIGQISGEKFHFNSHPKNEINLFSKGSDATIEIMNRDQSGDENYPCVLSVSFKKTIWL